MAMIKKLSALLTKNEKSSLIMLSLGAIVLSVSETFSIGIFIPLMGLFVNQENLHTSSILDNLLRISGIKDTNIFMAVLIILAILIFIFRAVFSIFMAYVQQKSIGKIYMRLSADVLQTYLEKPYSFHLSSNSSDLFKNVSLEVSQFITGFLTPVVLIFSEAIVLSGIFLFLLYVFPAITIFLISVFGLIVGATYAIFKKRIKLYSAQREKYSGQMYKNALESLHAVKEIKIFEAQGFFVKRFIESVRIYLHSFIKFSVVSVLPRYLFETVLVSLMLLSLFSGILLHKTFAEMIPIMTVFGLAAIRLVPSFSKIYSNINLFHYSRNSLDIVYGLLDKNIPTDNRTTGRANGPAGGEQNVIELQDISFCYENTPKPIFQRLNLRIPLQQTVAIVGLTGSGKSTLIDIMTGLLVPSSGNLYYRGLSIKEDNVIEYRRKIGYVSQNLCVIDDTITANIAFGVIKEEVDQERLKQVISISQLESFVRELPQGLDTLVGERGVRISGGQKQRIGIARALYRAPEIVIFDEATSALDRYTESKIYAALKDCQPVLSVIMVTHRIDTLKQSGYIYLIDSGQVAGQGDFKTLSDNSDIFRKIIEQKDTLGEV